VLVAGGRKWIAKKRKIAESPPVLKFLGKANPENVECDGKNAKAEEGPKSEILGTRP